MLRIVQLRHKQPVTLPRAAAGALLFFALVTLVSYAAVSRYLQHADAVRQDAAKHVNFTPRLAPGTAAAPHHHWARYP
jgi:hypothetical protein